MKRWHYDLKMKDSQGRVIGAQVTVCALDHDTPDWRGYEVLVQVTRDGEPFGRAPRGKVVFGSEAARAEVERRITAIMKRYAKIANAAAEGYLQRGIDPLTKHQRTIAYAEDTEAGKYDLEGGDMAVTVYRVKVGNQWARGDKRGDLTDNPAHAKHWSRVGHAKAHITNVKGRYYRTTELVIVPCQIVECLPDHAAVSLPTNDPVLADYLESIGYLDAANTLRGV